MTPGQDRNRVPAEIAWRPTQHTLGEAREIVDLRNRITLCGRRQCFKKAPVVRGRVLVHPEIRVEHRRDGHDEANWLNVAQPFLVREYRGVLRHGPISTPATDTQGRPVQLWWRGLRKAREFVLARWLIRSRLKPAAGSNTDDSTQAGASRRQGTPGSTAVSDHGGQSYPQCAFAGVREFRAWPSIRHRRASEASIAASAAYSAARLFKMGQQFSNVRRRRGEQLVAHHFRNHALVLFEESGVKQIHRFGFGFTTIRSQPAFADCGIGPSRGNRD